MKTGSKIAIAAAAVGAWLLVKKKGGISGIGGANDHLLPTVSEYSRYLDIAQNKFGISREQARKRYGLYTIGQWKKLLGIGKVEHSDYDGARVIAKDGRHAISFDIFGHGENGITVTSELKGGGERYGFEWEFLSHIGDYKTLSGAIKSAKKYWDRLGIEYNERDFNKI